MTEGENDEIGAPNLGAEGPDLPLWLATQAIRHAELRLAAQVTNLAAMEGRAVSILGWSTTSVLVLGAATVAGSHPVAAMLPAIELFFAAVACVVALWPRPWFSIGFEVPAILDSKYESESEVQQSLALGYQKSIEDNEERLIEFARLLRCAWHFIITAPIASLVALLIDKYPHIELLH